MGALFSGDINGNHYQPHEQAPDTVDLTRFDRSDPVVDPLSGQVIDYDWDMPDAMIVKFPSEKPIVRAWKKLSFVVQFKHLINRDD